MKLLVEGVIREREAGERLNLSLRQVQRLKKRFIEGGRDIESLSFRRKHREINKVPDSVREKNN